jgi:hypothetical protein
MKFESEVDFGAPVEFKRPPASQVAGFSSLGGR